MPTSLFAHRTKIKSKLSNSFRNYRGVHIVDIDVDQWIKKIERGTERKRVRKRDCDLPDLPLNNFVCIHLLYSTIIRHKKKMHMTKFNTMAQCPSDFK